MFGQMKPRLHGRNQIERVVGCTIFSTAVQSVANVTNTALQWNSHVSSATQRGFVSHGDAMHSTTVNNSRINILVPGIYVGVFQTLIAYGSQNVRDQFWRANGTSQLIGADDYRGAPLNNQTIGPQCALPPTIMSIGEYLEACVIHSQGGNLNYTPQALSLWRLGPAP
jgi:hypothetical protein